MSSSNYILQHPTLHCSLLGKPSTTSVQFRNLKYASIPSRYKDSTPLDTLQPNKDTGIFNATTFGPSCPQKRGAQAFDLTLLGNVMLPHEQGQGETEKMNEFECLHVNITVPKSVINAGRRKGQKLPVLIWIHGGGLRIGSNSWPQYDLQKWVDRSVEIGKPFVGVSMNYRLGIFGFLAAEEVGAMGNMGFKDQVLGFRWVKRHISGFGGDPDNVMAVGESAGGISLSTLLCANVGDEGLFEKVVIMSGEATLRKPRNKWWHKQAYLEQAKYLGLLANETEHLKSKLLGTEAEELMEKLPLAEHNCAYIDGDWMKEDITPKILANGHRIEHKPSWCKEFVIGDTIHDGTILKARILANPQALDRLKAICSQHLTRQETRRLLAAYKLDSNLSPEHKRDALLRLATDLRFYNMSRQAYKGWITSQPPKIASQYHFHVTNPFDGDLKGLASHELDVAFLLQNFNDQLDACGRRIARDMADYFIRFMDGERWAARGQLVVFDQQGILHVGEEKYDQLYRQGCGEVLGGIAGNRLWMVADEWQGVRSEEEELESTSKL
ncbi:Carboxylesterase [Phaeosphaeriaceae sp. PMI808]|nr:Carboxylesterase [Phaeosphaeriaceae sp. PMI808]